jgi:hypothetical protein
VNEAALVAAEIPDERRHVTELLEPAPDREPVEELPVDGEDVATVREQLADPRPDAQKQLLRAVASGIGGDDHAVGRCGPPLDALPKL